MITYAGVTADGSVEDVLECIIRSRYHLISSVIVLVQDELV